MGHSGAGWVAIALMGAMVLGAFAGLAVARPSGATSGAANVLEIYQTPNRITQSDNLSVYLEVADSSNIQQIYFTFCQLTNSLCYLPVVMTPQGGNWYEGSTNPMTAYPGMDPGVRAGYNITITYTDNSTLSEPSLPNAFANLTVAQSVTGENLFEMVVSNPVFGLSGTVTDAATGAPILGATVSLGPGNVTATTSTGTYSFGALVNGTYSLSVSKPGYRTSTQSVSVSGHNLVENVQLSNASVATSPGTSGSGGAGLGFLSTPLGIGAVAAVIVGLVAVAFVAVGLSRRRRGPRGASAGAADPGATPLHKPE